MNAIIFLAAISCFDQVLAEDNTVNRLVSLNYTLNQHDSPIPIPYMQEDSVLLWKSIISNPLLKDTNVVLFLNKCDILKTKLASGIKLGDWIVSYGDRPNDFECVSHCK